MAQSLVNKKASTSMAVLSSQEPYSRRMKSPLHSASIQITDDFADYANPQPWGPHQDERQPGSSEVINQGYLSPLKLVQLTGEPDLSRVAYLELSINTTENSLGNFGLYLPNLAQLRFIDSIVPCIRDLGTNLSSVKILWMSRCNLKDLDGLPALSDLLEFYLPFNNVEDVSIITMLSALEVLDLEGNDISEEDQLGYLALCPSLRSLTLEGNPLSITLAGETRNELGYRAAICKAVPGIKVLDDISFDKKDMSAEKMMTEEELASRSSLFTLSEGGMEKDWKIVQNSLKHHQAERDTVISPLPRPTTAPASTLSLSPPPSLDITDESSELTHGISQVICGNPVRALRARRQHGLTSRSATGILQSTTSPHSSQDESNLLSILQDWRLDPVVEDIEITRSVSEDNLDPTVGDEKLSSKEIRQTAHLSPTHTTAPLRLPTPPKTGPPSQTDPSSFNRPKSVADFRHRRYRKLSSESPRSFTAT